MGFLKYFIILALVIYSLSMLIISVRSGKAFKYIFLNAMLGVLILLILYFTKNFTGLNLAINKITIAISGVFGIVGVIALLFFNLIV